MLHSRLFHSRILAFALVLTTKNVVAVADDTMLLDNMVIVLIDQADVAASESGVIAEMLIREGEAVTRGQLLAQLDDREAELQRTSAQTELAIAEKKVAHSHLIDLAETKLAQQEQLMRQHEIAMQIADAKAENEVRVLASEKAAAVAKNELARAERARERFADSVSRSEIDALTLTYERAKLETKQAVFERDLDAMHAEAARQSANHIRLGIEQSKIELAAATADARIKQLEVDLGRQKHHLSELLVHNHQVTAPWDGVITKRFRNQGEWVKEGEPVLRLIRLDRLRAEGYATAAIVPRLRSTSTVTLLIDMGNGEKNEREGEIVFVSPELDPVNQERPFWVEFDNPRLDVLPGMRGSLSIAP